MPKARCTGSPDAIGAAAEPLFLESSFVTVGMDDLGGVSLASLGFFSCLLVNHSK
jgi:hypothetical protein